MPNFFRKERLEKFKKCFKASEKEAMWGIDFNSSTIFAAKASTGSLMVNLGSGQKIPVKWAVKDNDLQINYTIEKNYTSLIKEREMGDLVSSKAADPTSGSVQKQQAYLQQIQAFIRYKTIILVCDKHKNASTKSPFISGTVVDNFKAGATYTGYKLQLKLGSREPFANPLASGNEKEYFLVGSVSKGDCSSVLYMGYKPSGKSDVVLKSGYKVGSGEFSLEKGELPV
jgi:hypothetical protein